MKQIQSEAGRDLPKLLNILKVSFGYDSFRPGQAEIIHQVVGGGDALVLMPTGGGKSLCYQLPALARAGLTLVVSPLVALMKDQVDSLAANNIAAGCMHSAMESAEIAAIMRSAEAGTLKLLYIAPERLAMTDFKEWLNKLQLGLIAIDEAHCISEWGHDFRPDYRSLQHLRSDFPGVPLIALTATATGRVQDDIANQLNLTQAPRFATGFNRPNLTYRVRPKTDVTIQVKELLDSTPDGAAIVYRFSRDDCDKLASQLQALGVNAVAYHAGLNAQDRRSRQDAFMRDDVRVVVATIAFGMGIDKPDIRIVIHADLPKTLEGYYQETGRAGRDGLPAECLLLFSPGDRQKQAFFIGQIEDEVLRAGAQAKLEEMLAYARLVTCRRRYLLQYFGEVNAPQSCANCDTCLEPRANFDGTEIARKLLSTVARTGQRFGSAYIASVAAGLNDKKIVERAHNKLSVYGIAKKYDTRTLKEYIEQLVAKGCLIKSGGDYPILTLTNLGVTVLRGEITVTLIEPDHRPTASSRRRSSAIFDDAGGTDAKLFEKLRALRRQLAADQGVPPYMIFGDAALIAMTRVRPQSLITFAEVPGVGEAKLERYGSAFTAVIARYMSEAPSL